MLRSQRVLFFIVDIGFILYWLVTLMAVLPEAWLFKDYHDPILSAWNWSFLPLDLFISATGLASVRLWRLGDSRWKALSVVSLTLTFCSGLQAIAFWSLRLDFDPGWWSMNLFLMLYPLPFLLRHFRHHIDLFEADWASDQQG